MLPIFMIATAVGGKGSFQFNADPDAFAASVNVNGQTVDGQFDIYADGRIEWTGDAGGTNESDWWWFPTGTGNPSGTWHVRLQYVSGTNQSKSLGSDAINTWHDLSAATRTFKFEKTTSGSGGGSTDGVYTLEFSNDGGSTTYDTLDVNDITLTEPTL